ncbi:hypothetical protein BH09ACT5_BH09ACT5_04500 [soil metagenome]
MTGVAEEELRALRRRAYGPDADIHLDSSALQRLRELEDASRPAPGPARPPEAVVEVAPRTAHEPAVDLDVEGDAQHAGRERLRRFRLRARLVLRRLARLRRSTVLILLGLVVFSTATVAALILVERVQTDPLLVGAEQVARLSVDPSFPVPGIFAPSGEEGSARAFQEFNGVRPVVSDFAVFSGNRGDDCLTVFATAALDNATANSFSGFAMSGCSAGGFPATAQFNLDAQDVPGQLDTAFPEAVAVQFVYDSVHEEVVVFVTE